MSDEDLRARYRRDYTREPIKSPAHPHKPEPTDLSSVQPEKPKPTPVAEHVPETTQHTHETAPLPRINIEEQPVRRTRRKNKSGRGLFKKLLIMIFIIGVGIAIAAGGSYFYSKSHASSVPENIKSQSDVPVLYPEKLPAGFTVDKSSFNISGNNIVAYYATDSSGNHLIFNVQPRPANFDFDKFYSQVMTDATRFATPIGEAAVGNASGHLLGSLATDKSWVIVTGSNKNIDTDKIKTALSQMKVVQ